MTAGFDLRWLDPGSDLWWLDRRFRYGVVGSSGPCIGMGSDLWWLDRTVSLAFSGGWMPGSDLRWLDRGVGSMVAVVGSRGQIYSGLCMGSDLRWLDRGNFL